MSADNRNPKNREDRIEKQLSDARSRLLDLSLRNRLVNFRPSARRSIQITEEDVPRIYQELVLEERSLSFGALKAALKPEEEIVESPDGGDIADLPARKRKSSLQLRTKLDPEILPKRLFSIANEANSVLEEQGYTVLYLALGFLEWKDSPASETFRQAPLILIPVELSRTKVRESYRLSWTKEDIGTNLSLRERLLENGIALDDFEMPEDSTSIDDYLSSVSKAIRKQAEWRVTKNVHLGFFSFTKFVMYKDLDPEGWPDGQGPAQHPLIKRLFDPSEDGHDSADLYDESEIDDRLDWKLAHHVLDADPSQIVAIETVKAGNDLVVEGPPGTGKSQTIANLIGELLMQEKTVLFVSEKMAALEVVKKRLDNIGLGEFCLELHSRKSRKKEVLAELQRCLQQQCSTTKPESERGRNRLQKDIEELNEYARELREPFGTLYKSPYDLIGMHEQSRMLLSRANKDIPAATITSTTAWTMEKIEETIIALEDLVELRGMLTSKAVDAWRICSPGRLLPHDINDIKDQLRTALQSYAEFSDSVEEFSEALGSSAIRSVGQAMKVREAFETIASAPDIQSEAVESPHWGKRTLASVQELLEPISSAQHLREQAHQLFTEDALQADAVDLRSQLLKAKTGALSSFRRNYRTIAKRVNRLYLKSPSFFYGGYAADLQLLAQYALKRTALEQTDHKYRDCFGTAWAGEDSDVEKLRAIANWTLKFHEGIDNESWNVDLLRKASEETKDLTGTLERIQAFEDLADRTKDAIRDILENLGCSEIDAFSSPADEAGTTAVVAQLSEWLNSIDALGIWGRYQAQKSLDVLADISDLVNLVDQQHLDTEDIAPAIRYYVSKNQLREVFKEREALASFVSALHEKKIDGFRQLDRSLIEANHTLVCNQLRKRRPALVGGVSPESGMGILLREIGKKKRHISIRKLMEVAGPFIQKAKPCFMMSPLSIAQFLDPRSTRFDVIIFDEASQVRPEDALGALLRGDQLVVMGDTKQLPPTSFFDRLVEDMENEDDDSVADIESILQLCRRSFPNKTLRWHYRSRHESLIAVSNHEFYDNNLVFYPSPMQEVEGLGLKFNHIPDTVYDRGKSSENRQEAIAVARAAIQHYKTTPTLSLGVGAFSSKQQNAILEEVHRELQEHPEMETYFASTQPEHFFVKNLETIQGDERDVIFLSVGYGFDREHKLSKNFGPVNREGGERRLNVLITRSRRQCVVFSNFTGDDLQVDATGARGVRALKTFLKYAETGDLRVPEATGADTDSPFEDAVYEFLSAEGHDVRKQVGEAGFRIDLAVVDPAKPGRFILGVECDGAKYHSSQVARERDRLRQQILEGLGWRIHRVWSTDWFTRRKDAQEKLLRAIDHARSNVDALKGSNTLDARQQPNQNKILTAVKTQPEQAVSLPEAHIVKKALPTNAYAECWDLTIATNITLADAPRSRLALAVAAIVEVEGPIHVDEVVRRIRTLWGLKRSGIRIQEAVKRGIQLAVSNKTVERKIQFLWPLEQKDVQVRCRKEREMLKIELICNQEIEAAIVSTLEIQFASPRDAIPTTAARLLGFQQASEQIRKRIDKVVGQMLKTDKLVQAVNGTLDLPDDR